MSHDESKPSDIPETPAENSLPPAWQPLTRRGVAAFSKASIGRLLFIQCVVALLVAGTVLWFLASVWFPIIRESIGRLPDTGTIQNQQLASPHASTAPLSENRFLTFLVDVNGTGLPSVATDFRVEFRQRNAALCSIYGCLVREYPPDWAIQFNRPELESWWGAWQLAIYTFTGVAVVVWLFASWFVLATLYGPIARIYSFFKDRRVTLVGSWKLAAAALLPGALMIAGAIVLYGLGLIGLQQFLILWVLHFIVGWVYLFASSLQLPSASDSANLPRNPFETEMEARKGTTPNPFAGDGPSSSTPQDPQA
jgi:hypothetical protein